MKTTLAGTVMLVLLLFTENAAAQPNWVAVAETATPAVVTIEHDEGAGSGFIVAANGTIVTNEHVIQGATSLTITLSSGETFNDAYLIMSDPARDLAILRIMGADLPYLNLRATPAEVGENVALIGAPQGLSSTLTTGIVSRKLIHEGSRTIQTDVSASPGSSGSPLLDEDGDVVGVLTWKLRTGDQQVWQERVTDVAMSILGAVNDLSKDLAREIRERSGGPCVSNSRETEASREEDPETPRRVIRYVVGPWTADEICNHGFTGKVNTQEGHVICENGTATEIVER